MAKNEIKREDLIDKKLEELILSRDEQHDLISIYVPLIFSLLGIIASAITSVKPEILINYPKLGILITKILLISMIVVIAIPFIIIRKHKIIKKNLKVYDDLIIEKIKEYKKSEQNYKNDVIKALDELKIIKEGKK